MIAVPEAALQELDKKASGPRQTRLLVLSGPSGAGKDAVLHRLRQRMSDVHVVVTCTTRARRPHEVEGVDYQFISQEAYLDLRARGDLLEDVQYAGHYYGTPAQDIRDAMARGQDVILKIEVRGASIVKLKVPGTVLIFVSPPSVDALVTRLMSARQERGNPSQEDLDRRLADAQREFGCIPGYDYLIVNHTDRLDEAVDQLETIIRAERARVNVPPVRV